MYSINILRLTINKIRSPKQVLDTISATIQIMTCCNFLSDVHISPLDYRHTNLLNVSIRFL